jgi:uncharacterized phage infection (PIP) family protein YhgE
MRKGVFLLLGLLELTAALVLAAIAWQLPGRTQVDDSFGRAERITRRSSDQVAHVRRQLHDLRRPEIQELATRLRSETRTVTGTLREQTIDFEAVRTTRDALGDVASGLDSLGQTLDPEALGKLGDGLGTTAAYLDQKVAPTASQAAQRLEEATEALRVDAVRLSKLLRQTPLDLKAAREIADGMGAFSKGLEQMSGRLEVQRLETIREGFQGLETSLSTGAAQVERLSGYTYPVVTFQGLKPHVEQRHFWPDGEKIAQGMRKAAEGVKEAAKETERMAEDLPRLRASLEASRKVADRTREALLHALKQQDQVEPLLRDVPEHSARLAEELPKLGADLAQVLRDTARLKEVAAALRQAQKGIDSAVARWPELRTSLGRSATLLRILQQQLDQVIQHRGQYERALRQTAELSDMFVQMLPWYTEHMERQLAQQEDGLTELGQTLDEFGDTLPAAAQATSSILLTARLLLALVAGIVCLHGAYLILSSRLGPQFSA